MYADDTCVNIASENLNDLLTELKNELENISHWMRINKLSLNASKSEYMVIGHRRQLMICQILSSIMKLSKEFTRQNT